MNYVKHFNMFGVEAQQIPCITGAGAPTTETEGAVGCFYMDTDNGDVYKCIKVEGDVYTWKKENEGIIEVELETEHGSDGFIPLFTKEGTVATTLDEVHSGVFKLKYPTMYETILLQTKDYVISDRVDCVNQILWVRNFIRVRVGITEIPTDYLAWDTINLKDIAELKTDKEDISNKSDTIDDTADDVKYPTTKAVKNYVDTSAEINTIDNTAEGSAINITDSADAKLKGLKIYGKTTQEGEPSIENPQELINVGNSGSITTKVYGVNLFNPSGISAGSYNYEGTALKLSNTYGTTINSTEYTGKIIVTQSQYKNDVDYVGHYENGMFVIGLYNHILKFEREYMFIADIKTTNILSGSNGAIFFTSQIGIAKQGVIKNNKLYFNFKFTQNTDYPERRFIEIRPNGMSFELSNIMIVEGNAVDKDIAYEPYKEPQTFTLNTPNGLPGVPVSSGGNYTDENGQLWICDEIDLARGKYIKRIGIYTTSQYDTATRGKIEETIGEYQCFYLYNKIPSNNNTLHDNSNAFCNKFIHQSVYNKTFEGFYISDAQKDGKTDDVTISVKISRLLNYGYSTDNTSTQVTAFNAWLKDNPLTFAYIMAEPIETDLNLTDEEISQYKALTTYKPVTNIFNDADAHMKVDYVADTKTYIDNKFANIENAILSLGGNV